MDGMAVIGLSVLFSFAACGAVMRLYIWPRVVALPREEALMALVAPHMFRFVGLSFLMTGVVGPNLPASFAASAAYGDLAAATLAMIALWGLSRRAAWAVAAVWVFNIEGSLDLLFAFYQGMIATRLPEGALGAAFFIPTAIVPPLLVLHVAIFWLLLRGRRTIRA